MNYAKAPTNKKIKKKKDMESMPSVGDLLKLNDGDYVLKTFDSDKIELTGENNITIMGKDEIDAFIFNYRVQQRLAKMIRKPKMKVN